MIVSTYYFNAVNHMMMDLGTLRGYCPYLIITYCSSYICLVSC